MRRARGRMRDVGGPRHGHRVSGGNGSRAGPGEAGAVAPAARWEPSAALVDRFRFFRACLAAFLVGAVLFAFLVFVVFLVVTVDVFAGVFADFADVLAGVFAGVFAGVLAGVLSGVLAGVLAGGAAADVGSACDVGIAPIKSARVRAIVRTMALGTSDRATGQSSCFFAASITARRSNNAWRRRIRTAALTAATRFSTNTFGSAACWIE